MKISDIAKNPELVELVIDDENIVETYGESITFYTWDSVSMETYFDFFNARAKSEYDALIRITKTMILNEDGKPVLTENVNLPVDILTAAIIKIGDILGNSQSKKSTRKTGKQQKS